MTPSCGGEAGRRTEEGDAVLSSVVENCERGCAARFSASPGRACLRRLHTRYAEVGDLRGRHRRVPGEPELLHLHGVRRDLGVDQLEEEEEGLDGAGGFRRRRDDDGVLRLVARLHGGGAGHREVALIGNRQRARGRRAAAPRRVWRRRPELSRLPVSPPGAGERWSSCCATPFLSAQ
jgi:hypothetical protein